MSEVVLVDEIVPCFLTTKGLCKRLYGDQYGSKCKFVRKQRLSQSAWSMVGNIARPELYDSESRLAQCAHVLCYTYLLVNDVLGDSNETEALQAACNMLHIGVPLGLLPQMPYPLLVYLF